MELPISKESYRPGVDSFVRAAKRARLILGRAVAEEQTLDGAAVLHNADRPMVRCANFAMDLQGDCTVALDFFRDKGLPCHALDGADAAWPHGVAAPPGFAEKTRHVFLLQRYAPPAKRSDGLQIVPARSLYPELRRFYERFARMEHHAADLCAEQLAGAMVDRLDEARLELFVGRLGGQPACVTGVLSLGDIGVIEPAWTDPDHRGKGVAATLMDYTLDHCSRAQFEHVIVDRGDGCASIPFYEKLGFGRVASYLRYIRTSDADA